MTVTNETNLVSYLGNGATTEFDYTFFIPSGGEDDYFEVYLLTVATGDRTDLVLDVDYSITGVGADEPGGTVTYPLSGSPLTAASRIVIERIVPYVQELDIQATDGFNPRVVENQLDLMVMQIQQVAERQERTPQVPVGTSQADLTGLIGDVLRLADSIDEIDTVAENIDAVLLIETNIEAVQDAAANATAAAASAASAATSASNAAASAAAAATFNPVNFLDKATYNPQELTSDVYGGQISPANFVYNHSDRAADGLRSIMEWIPANIRTDIRNAEHTGDLWAYFNSALQSGEDIDLGIGEFKITDYLNPARQGQVFKGRDRFSTVIKIEDDFNLTRDYVLAMVPWMEATDFFIQFEQPADATAKAELVEYPWAVRGAQRAGLRRVGWGAAWRGFDGRQIDLTNNCTGMILEDIRDGSFDIGADFDGIYDFIKVDNWHSWEFGFTNTPLADIAYDEPGVISFGLIESFSGGAWSLWQKRMVFDAGIASGADDLLFTKSFASIKLDGWASRFEMSAGIASIGILDMLCDNNLEHSLVTVSGGTTNIGLAKLQSFNTHVGQLLNVSGGLLSIDGGYLGGTGDQRYGLVSGGELAARNLAILSTGGNRSNSFFEASSTGRLTLEGNAPKLSGAGGTGNFVSIAGTGSSVRNNDFAGYSANVPNTLGNDVQGNRNVGDAF